MRSWSGGLRARRRSPSRPAQRAGLSDAQPSRSWCRSRRAAATDILARMLAPAAGAAARQAVRGREQARRRQRDRAPVATAKAAPDGYTLMRRRAATMAVNPTMFKNLPYDPAEGFRAGRAGRRRAVRAGGQSGAAGASRSPIWSSIAKEQGPAVVRYRRAGRSASSVRRAAQEHDRHRDDAGAVPRQRAGA